MTGCTSMQEASTIVPALPPTLMPTNTPDPIQLGYFGCAGWNCSMEGVVYMNTAIPGNEMEGIVVSLTQHSNCSPTEGEYATTTGKDGRFDFPLYVHDTDTFWIKVEMDGYEPARQRLGGFDCLNCLCRPPIEIVLRPRK